MPSGRAAWGYAMCMVAYQMVEECVCRLGNQAAWGYAMCMTAYQVVEEGVCRTEPSGSMGICYVYGSLPDG